jgi:hypothetical protein
MRASCIKLEKQEDIFYQGIKDITIRKGTINVLINFSCIYGSLSVLNKVLLVELTIV